MSPLLQKRMIATMGDGKYHDLNVGAEDGCRLTEVSIVVFGSTGIGVSLGVSGEIGLDVLGE